jgi:hypothetical protein
MSRPSRWLLVAGILAGCATTQVDVAGGPPLALCAGAGTGVPTQVFWMPRWRSDQKEPAVREALAERGLRAWAEASGCTLAGTPRRVDTDDDAALRRQAASRIVLVVVRELGPRVEIGGPALVRGSTEVVLDLKVLEAPPSTASASRQTVWRNGGPGVVKGIATLEQDLADALRASFAAR